MLEIFPLKSLILLVGSRDEAPNELLAGHVSLRLLTPTKITSLTLKLKILVSEHATFPPNDKKSTKILNSTILLQPQNSSLLTLPPGNHSFPFEFQLTGDLAETVSNRFVSVKYVLVAELKRPGWRRQSRANKEILVSRLHVPNEMDQLAMVILCNRWPSYMEYQLMIDTKVIRLGQIVPVKFTWWPFIRKIQIRSVEFTIVERTIHARGELDRWLPIKSHMMLDPPMEANKLAHIKVPSGSQIHPDMSNHHITIQHRLEMNVTFEANQKWNSILLKCNIILIPNNEEASEDLPSYSQALLAPNVS
ncbi:hypothetical protein K493DRAFT_383871 [Basidiobolus meristosporus CBS 931.73]|uniref:Arrestin C-terminal-like domain-containing protein n=1 Tax=Basidiobolus meristosporus CBS 931.73 TaxID=1314790 RepID=A0A1Y1XTC6_9FUNG|nr:hypothetical protein K493DRAFT_383871 [Basidiobolus meristosporus CBS 931.73]|eukprot:ORX89019.1 hypothetical protein K493DRAFT_383871 [Basidiobolus meristosporus CBS 931.73]